MLTVNSRVTFCVTNQKIPGGARILSAGGGGVHGFYAGREGGQVRFKFETSFRTKEQKNKRQNNKRQKDKRQNNKRQKDKRQKDKRQKRGQTGEIQI